jgi:hypothetical protein
MYKNNLSTAETQRTQSSSRKKLCVLCVSEVSVGFFIRLSLFPELKKFSDALLSKICHGKE